MNGVEAADDAVPGTKERILNGQINATDQEICAIAKFSKDLRSEIVAELEKPKKERDKEKLRLPEKPTKKEAADLDERRFLVGSARNVQGKKRKLSETDRADLKKSVNGRYYQEPSADGSSMLYDIQGAHDDLIERWKIVFRGYPDTMTESEKWKFVEKHLDNLQRYLEFVRTRQQKALKGCSYM